MAAAVSTGRTRPKPALAPYSNFSAPSLRMPARISRRCITVTSLGECGMKLPSFRISACIARLGCAGIWSVDWPPPATRSMASLGRTYSFMPAPASAMAKPTKTTTVMKKGMALNLDIHDLFHDQVAHDLQKNGATQHHIAHIVCKKELHVVRIGVKHQDRHGDRNTA